MPLAPSTPPLLALTGGAVLGLALAGQVLFSTHRATQTEVPPENVALVNQRPILMSDFVAQVEVLWSKPFAHTTAAERRQVLDDMVREEVFVQRGVELDFPATDPETRNALVAAVEQQVAAEVNFAPPGEEALRDHHRRHAQAFQSVGRMAVQDWVFTPEAPQGPAQEHALAQARGRALQALAALRGGAGGEAALRQAGFSPHDRTQGEAFYVAAQAKLGELLFDQARLLAPGAWSQPLVVPAAGGRVELHVLQVLQHHPPKPLSFEQARADVLKAYQRDETTRRLRATETYLRNKAQVLLAAPYAAP